MSDSSGQPCFAATAEAVKPRVTRSSIGNTSIQELKEEAVELSRSPVMSGRRVRSRTGTPTNDNSDQSISSMDGQSPAVPSLKRKMGMATASPASTTRRLRSNKLNADEESDSYCWICRKDGVISSCALCPRVYHARCLGITPTESDWICVECEKVMRSECEDTRPSTLANISIEQLNTAFQYALERMKVPNSEVFQIPVDPALEPEYHKIVAHPMDMTTLEKNIKKKQYGSPDAFLADAKWILHNCIIYNGMHNKYTATCKTVLKVCRTQMMEIDTCPDCYLNSCIQDTNWFCKPCRDPHPLVWAKLKGYPFWPAKAVKEVDGQVDCRFFGAHDRAWVNTNQVFLLSKEPPAVVKNKKGIGFDGAMEELTHYITKFEAKNGPFQYSAPKEPYKSENAVSPAGKRVKISDDNSERTDSQQENIDSTQNLAKSGGAVNTESALAAPAISSPSSRSVNKQEFANDDQDKMASTDDDKTASTDDGKISSTDDGKMSSTDDGKMSSTGDGKMSITDDGKTGDTYDGDTASTVDGKTGNTDDKIGASGQKIVMNEINPVRTMPVAGGKKEGVFTLSDDMMVGAQANYHFPAEEPTTSPTSETLVNKLEQKIKSAEEQDGQMDCSNAPTKSNVDKTVKESPMDTSDAEVNGGLDPKSPQNETSPTVKRAEFSKKLLNTIESCKNKLGIDESAEVDGNQEVSSSEEDDDGDESSEDEENTSREDENEQLPVMSSPKCKPIKNRQRSYKPVAAPLNIKLKEMAGVGEIDWPSHMSKIVQTVQCTFIDMLNQLSNGGPSNTTPSNSDISDEQKTDDAKMQSAAKSASSTVTAAAVTTPTPSIKTDKVQETTSNETKNGAPSQEKNPSMSLGKEQLEKLSWKHKCEIDAIKHNADLAAVELRKSIELEKERALWRLRKQLEHKYKKLVEETKKKQWCAMCGKEAIFYCCWNTSYCDYPCQQRHWPNHLKSCAQLQKDGKEPEPENGSAKPTGHVGNSADRAQQSKSQTSLPAYSNTTSVPTSQAYTTAGLAPPQYIGPHQNQPIPVQYMPVQHGSVYQAQMPLQAVPVPVSGSRHAPPASAPVLYPVMQQAPGAHPPQPQSFMVGTRPAYKLAPKY